MFEDFAFLMNGETSTDCYARFQSQLSSGVHGDHASICTSTHGTHGVSSTAHMFLNASVALTSATRSCAAACQYQPTFLCQAHHHEASCQPQEAVFTGVAGSDDAPSTGDARSYVATGQNLLFAVNVRGDDDDRHHARSACADSYLADSSEDQRCAPGCVAAVVDADDGPEETCLPVRRCCLGLIRLPTGNCPGLAISSPVMAVGLASLIVSPANFVCAQMSDVGGFHAAVECIAGTGGGR